MAPWSEGVADRWSSYSFLRLQHGQTSLDKVIRISCVQYNPRSEWEVVYGLGEGGVKKPHNPSSSGVYLKVETRSSSFALQLELTLSSDWNATGDVMGTSFHFIKVSDPTDGSSYVASHNINDNTVQFATGPREGQNHHVESDNYFMLLPGLFFPCMYFLA